jgi:hypothetical protein
MKGPLRQADCRPPLWRPLKRPPHCGPIEAGAPPHHARIDSIETGPSAGFRRLLTVPAWCPPASRVLKLPSVLRPHWSRRITACPHRGHWTPARSRAKKAIATVPSVPAQIAGSVAVAARRGRGPRAGRPRNGGTGPRPASGLDARRNGGHGCLDGVGKSMNLRYLDAPIVQRPADQMYTIISGLVCEAPQKTEPFTLVAHTMQKSCRA